MTRIIEFIKKIPTSIKLVGLAALIATGLWLDKDSPPTRPLKFYRGTPRGDNLAKGIPDYILLEMTRNSPTLMPDRIVDYLSWYKREKFGDWQKWDEVSSRAYTRHGLNKYWEEIIAHSESENKS